MQIQKFYAVNLTRSPTDEGTLSISSEIKWKTKGNAERRRSSCHEFFQWRNNTNLGTALLLFNRQQKPPGCKCEGNKCFWDMMPLQLENTNVSESTTVSIFEGLAVQTLKIEATWCPKHSNYCTTDTATCLRNLFLQSKILWKVKFRIKVQNVRLVYSHHLLHCCQHLIGGKFKLPLCFYILTFTRNMLLQPTAFIPSNQPPEFRGKILHRNSGKHL
jgi:hypothetical protein